MKNERRKSFILYLDNSIILDQLTVMLAYCNT